MSPVLQTAQLICGRTPFTICKASNRAGVGFFLKKAGVYTSIGIGDFALLISFNVPETTSSSN